MAKPRRTGEGREDGLLMTYVAQRMSCFVEALFPFKRTQRTQRTHRTQRTQRTQHKHLHCVRCVRCVHCVRCVRCVNEKRKQRKRLIGCFDDWLLRSTIPVGVLADGACVRCVKNLTQCFCLRNFLAFSAFLVHFLFCFRIFSYTQDLACVACVA